MPNHTVTAHDGHLEVTDSAGFVARMRWESYARLANATDAQRRNFRVTERGVHWPDVDEDLSFARLMAQFGKQR